MEENNEISNELFVNKHTVIYIYVTTILAYFILDFIVINKNINIPLIFRVYYISLSIVLFVLLNQAQKFYKQYVSKIMMLFFSLMILISSVIFWGNIIYGKNTVLNKIIRYIAFSKESILLIETFSIYMLSEYYFNKRELKKLYCIMIFFISTSIILTSISIVNLAAIKIIYTVIEVLLFIKIILKYINLNISKKTGWNIIGLYIFSTILIAVISIGEIFSTNQYIANMVIEIIHLINFRIVWSFVITELVREPYRNLSNSLSEHNKELDRLNLKIAVSNRQLEKSINLLKSKEYLYSTFFRFMPHPIIILNAENDRIIFANKQFLKLAGISKQRDIINKKMNNYIEFISDNIEKRDYNAIFHMGDKRKYIETKLLSNFEDATRKLILIKDKTSKVQTEKIRKEVENKKIEEKIRREFLSSISHDLKTPISVIYSAMQVEKIYIKKQDLEVLNKYNNISKQNCISLIKLTNNLIDNSKINSNFLTPTLENINIVEAIEDNVMTLIDYVKWNNIDLIFDTNTEECYLNIDHEFMDRIILNLISNSVKYTSDGGKIYVIINENTDKVTISVKDNGSGIEQKFIYEAFNKYAVGENCKLDSKSGTGIGLSVVKQLVELQGGNIEIKRNIDRGTTVSMEFKKESSNV